MSDSAAASRQGPRVTGVSTRERARAAPPVLRSSGGRRPCRRGWAVPGGRCSRPGRCRRATRTPRPLGSVGRRRSARRCAPARRALRASTSEPRHLSRPRRRAPRAVRRHLWVGRWARARARDGRHGVPRRPLRAPALPFRTTAPVPRAGRRGRIHGQAAAALARAGTVIGGEARGSRATSGIRWGACRGSGDRRARRARGRSARGLRSLGGAQARTGRRASRRPHAQPTRTQCRPGRELSERSRRDGYALTRGQSRSA